MSESGAHTNDIESRWNALKKSLPRYGTSKELYNSFFAEYCIRRKCLSVCRNKLLEFLQLIACVYQPESQPPEAELLPEAPPAAPASEPETLPTAASGTTFHVANFDLQFHLSSDDDEFDTSADMFL